MGATYPDVYAAIGVHSGLACGAANDIPSAFTAMRQGDLSDSSRSGDMSTVLGDGSAVPTIVFHARPPSLERPPVYPGEKRRSDLFSLRLRSQAHRLRPSGIRRYRY